MAYVSDLSRRLGLSVNSKSNFRKWNIFFAIFQLDSLTLTLPQSKVDQSFLCLGYPSTPSVL